MEQLLNKMEALRGAAFNIERSTTYQWGHMGLCNCGFLAQEVTALTKEEIHRRAMLRHGDWSEQLNDYCATSGLPMDDLISELIAFGFTRDELAHLERLSDPRVLQKIPHAQKLKHNCKTDVVRYLRAWAELIEMEVIQGIQLPVWKSKKLKVESLKV
ncbi:MAG: hypothetical protein JNJ65_06565 [Cyclobacteriaceae bacterium]|nr:hypothetical protein [Cyclobacteriaceae bacterium]